MKVKVILLAATAMAVAGITGCSHNSVQEGPFKGEWREDRVVHSEDEGDVTFTSYVKLNLYEKIDIDDEGTQCYGIYEESNDICGSCMSIDSVLSIDGNEALVVISQIGYPESSKETIQLIYNSEDGSLEVKGNALPRVETNKSGHEEE